MRIRQGSTVLLLLAAPLPPGDWSLSFDFRYPRDGYIPAPETVEAGTTDLVLEWARKP